jgi:hypothetical protein
MAGLKGGAVKQRKPHETEDESITDDDAGNDTSATNTDTEDESAPKKKK